MSASNPATLATRRSFLAAGLAAPVAYAGIVAGDEPRKIICEVEPAEPPAYFYQRLSHYEGRHYPDSVAGSIAAARFQVGRGDKIVRRKFTPLADPTRFCLAEGSWAPPLPDYRLPRGTVDYESHWECMA